MANDLLLSHLSCVTPEQCVAYRRQTQTNNCIATKRRLFFKKGSDEMDGLKIRKSMFTQ